jgi:hypothetical protein
MDANEPVEEALRNALQDEGMEGEEVLAVLVRTLADRHVDVEMRKRRRRPAWTPGNERTDALVAAMDALHEFGHRDAQTAPRRAQAQQTLFRVLTVCMMAAQRAAGLDRDDDGDDPPTQMRLVRD